MIDTDTSEPQNERPEPGATVLELLSEYGTQAVLEALALAAECASDDPEFCPEVHNKAVYLHLEFSQLLERYAVICAEPPAPAPIPVSYPGAIVV
jgi:hypothetical protein